MRPAFRVLLILCAATPAAAFTVPDVEPIYGVVVSRDVVTVSLGHAGCTKKSDLTVAVAKTPPRPLVLIARKHPAACLDSGRVEVSYSLDQLGLAPGEPFSLANPLVGAP